MRLKKRYAATHAVSLLFLTLLLTSCANNPKPYEVVKRPHLPIPANLLVECPVPEIPASFTYGDSVILNLQMLSSLDECNGKLRAIEQIEELEASH